MKNTHFISHQPLSLSDIQSILERDAKLELSTEARNAIARCRSYLDEKIATAEKPIYGVNTGFGSLYSKSISADHLEQLQYNLLVSHACGVGPRIPAEIVRLMLLLKIQSLSYGHSGVQLETVERLMTMFNQQALPVVYEMGSLGASGDLAPLAHLCLPLLGLGEATYEGKTCSGAALLRALNLEPIRLQAKEGLALLNGTQFMTAYGVHAVLNSQRLLKCASYIGALSLDGFDGCLEPFDELVHRIRPHKGQLEIAREMMRLLVDSQMAQGAKQHVQDPYSFRCIPQVHGASKDAIDFATQVFTTEINSVSDNPNCFPDQDKIISAGNFHGQHLALSMDFLALALSELGNISERRAFQLISGNRGLPHYLTPEPGINSGLMILQYTAAGLASQNKQLCTPASADSIVSSNGQEDHVSMGANAGVKLYRVVNNVYSILAIELVISAQAIDFRRPLHTSPLLERFIGEFRQRRSFIEKDRVLQEDIAAAEAFIRTAQLL